MKTKIVDDETIITALISTGSIKETAEIVNLKPHTISVRMRDPSFKQLYRDIKADMLKDAAALIQSRLSEAINTLYDIMKDPEAPPQTRANCAESLIRNTLKFTETADIMERLEDLEYKLAETERIVEYEDNVEESSS